MYRYGLSTYQLTSYNGYMKPWWTGICSRETSKAWEWWQMHIHRYRYRLLQYNSIYGTSPLYLAVKLRAISVRIDQFIRACLWVFIFICPCLLYIGSWKLLQRLGLLGGWFQSVAFNRMIMAPTMHLLGPAWIKLGQWASTRADLLPSAIIQTLSSRLHHNAPSHSISWTKQVLLEDFGIPMEEIFSEFDDIPIGSGSIAQVHKATLRSTKEQVAVKIVHPNAQELLSLDCQVLLTLTNFLTSYILPSLKWIRLPEQIQHFSKALNQQANLETEAHHLLIFRNNFRSSPNIQFPSPCFPWVSRRVLVESFVSGQRIHAFMRQDPATTVHHISYSANREIVKELFHAFIQMSLLDNFIHADLHAGNMFVQAKDDATTPPKIVLIDVGLINKLPDTAFSNLLELFKSIVIWRDGFSAGRLLLEGADSSFHAPNHMENDSPDLEKYLQSIHPTVIDPIGFCLKMRNVVHSYFTSHPPPRSLHMPLEKYEIGPVLHQVFEAVREHHVQLDPQYANFLMSVIFIEGIGRQLCPDLDLLPFFRQAAIHYFLLR